MRETFIAATPPPYSLLFREACGHALFACFLKHLDCVMVYLTPSRPILHTSKSCPCDLRLLLGFTSIHRSPPDLCRTYNRLAPRHNPLTTRSDPLPFQTRAVAHLLLIFYTLRPLPSHRRHSSLSRPLITNTIFTSTPLHLTCVASVA